MLNYFLLLAVFIFFGIGITCIGFAVFAKPTKGEESKYFWDQKMSK